MTLKHMFTGISSLLFALTLSFGQSQEATYKSVGMNQMGFITAEIFTLVSMLMTDPDQDQMNEQISAFLDNEGIVKNLPTREIEVTWELEAEFVPTNRSASFDISIVDGASLNQSTRFSDFITTPKFSNDLRLVYAGAPSRDFRFQVNSKDRCQSILCTPNWTGQNSPELESWNTNTRLLPLNANMSSSLGTWNFSLGPNEYRYDQ